MKVQVLAFSLLLFSALPLSCQNVAAAVPDKNQQPATTQSPSEADFAADLAKLDITSYCSRITKLLAEDRFDEIDRIARWARTSKARFPGGGWKLHTLYDTLQTSQNPALHNNIDRLKRWTTQRPESVTARVALAQEYVDYAWQGRGNAFADSVTADQWRLFRERMNLARESLDADGKLSEKCPQWYVVMQLVGRYQGLDIEVLTKLAEEAMSQEPQYYYIYQEHAITLTTSWYGAPGDSEKYAENVANRIGGRQGAIIYFQIATVLHCLGCSENSTYFARMSWPRIQEGYAAQEELFGKSMYKLNLLAVLAVNAGDAPTAMRLLIRIGDNIQQSIWGSPSRVESSWQWATQVRPKAFSDSWNIAMDNLARPDGALFYQNFGAAIQIKKTSLLRNCMASVKDDKYKFFLVLSLDDKGRVKEAAAWPPTRLSECTISKLKEQTFAVPPRSPFWMLFESVPKPTMQREVGDELPESGS